MKNKKVYEIRTIQNYIKNNKEILSFGVFEDSVENRKKIFINSLDMKIKEEDVDKYINPEIKEFIDGKTENILYFIDRNDKTDMIKISLFTLEEKINNLRLKFREEVKKLKEMEKMLNE